MKEREREIKRTKEKKIERKGKSIYIYIIQTPSQLMVVTILFLNFLATISM